MTTKIVEIDGVWYLESDGERAKMSPQPNLGQVRFNGEWTVYMGYPIGHDIPIFTPSGLWQGEEYDKAVSDFYISFREPTPDETAYGNSLAAGLKGLDDER